MRVKKKHLKIAGVLCVLLVILGMYLWMDSNRYTEPTEKRLPLGNPNAELVIIEFSDLQCPACKLAHPIIKKVIEDFGDDFRFEFYHFPLNIHPLALPAAKAAECASDQGAFYEYVDSIFLNQNELDNDMLYRVAEELGLDTRNFKKCMKLNVKAKIVSENVQLGESMGVRGTPTFFVDGKHIEQWDYAGLEAAIKEFYGRE